MSPNLEIGFCLEALKEALAKNTPEIFNSDQDSRFTSPQFTHILEQEQVKISMDSKGKYLDNIFTERLWRTVKYEDIYLKHYENIREAELGLEKYFNFYNNKRFHSSLEDLTPAQVYFQGQNQTSQQTAVLNKHRIEIPNRENESIYDFDEKMASQNPPREHFHFKERDDS